MTGSADKQGKLWDFELQGAAQAQDDEDEQEEAVSEEGRQGGWKERNSDDPEAAGPTRERKNKARKTWTQNGSGTGALEVVHVRKCTCARSR